MCLGLILNGRRCIKLKLSNLLLVSAASLRGGISYAIVQSVADSKIKLQLLYFF